MEIASFPARHATVACIALGAVAGGILGVPHGWIVLQLCLTGLSALLMSPALASGAIALRQASFAIGFYGAAYAGFEFGVPAGLRMLAWIPLVGLVTANAACTGCLAFLGARMVGSPTLRVALVLPAGWVVQEWLFSLGHLAFPWARLGCAQAPDGPLAGLLPMGGTLLASAAMMSLAALAALAVAAWSEARLRTVAVASLAVWLVLAGAGSLFAWTQPVSPLTADLVQSGITASERGVPGTDAALLRNVLNAARRGQAPLLVTSQLAIPKVPAALPAGYLQEIAAALAARHGDALIGMYFSKPGAAEFYNGVLAVGQSGFQRYLKYQLFPFGEFLPLPRRLLEAVQRRLPTPQRDTARPVARGESLTVAGHRVALAVCYEAAFADAWRQQAAAADILINMASDGSTRTMQLARQARQIDQARALEMRKPLLRTSDIDGTYALDDRGRVVAVLAAGRPGLLRASVVARAGLTPYARFGDLLALAWALVALSAALMLDVRRAGPACARTPACHGAALDVLPRGLGRQAGQIIPLSVCLLLLAGSMFYLMVNAGQSVTEKIRVTNAADAAAYSAATVEARALNYDAYLNRAIVANEIVIAQMVSYGSWLEYFATASDNYEASASDVNFYVLPNTDVLVLDVAFGGTEFVTHYYGQTAQEYVDYAVDYAIGPIVTLHDLVILALSGSEMFVQADLTAGHRQGEVANDVVKAMDPALRAEVVPTTLLLASGFDRFTKDYGGYDRDRLKDVTMRSRDPFSRERNWTLSGSNIPVVRKNGSLKKRGGTDLVGFDEWRGVDTLEVHGQSFGCGRFGLSWCDDIKEPVGWGGLEVDAGGGDAGNGYHGNAYGENGEAAQIADENMQQPQYYHFSGLPHTREIRNLDPANQPTTGITVLVSKKHADTLTSGNAAVAAPSGSMAMFGDHPAHGEMMALARATVYFDRTSPRADGKQEIGSLYNPYWRVHLTAPLEADRLYAATKQDGLMIPTTP